MLRRTFLQMIGALGLAPLFGIKPTPADPQVYIVSAAPWMNFDCTKFTFRVYDNDHSIWRAANLTASRAASDSATAPSADSPDRA